MLHGHGGNSIDLARQLGCAPEEIIDMSSNINPLGPPPGLVRYLKRHINAVGSFPEVDSQEISERFAGSCDIDPDRVLAGNGTTQIIYSIPQALEIRRALIVGPTYSDYADACHLHHVKTSFVFAEASKNFEVDINQIKSRLNQADAVFICNPNNPTGSLMLPDDLKALCRSYAETAFIIDESYLPFVPDGQTLSLRRLDAGNLLVLSSISKIFAIPGLRIGFVASHAEMIKKFKRFLQPWSVNSLAQLAVRYLTANKDETDAFIGKTQRYIQTERRRFLKAAKDFSDIHLFPSMTNFMLAELPDDLQADDVISQLTPNKILVRNCDNFQGLSSRYIRISFKSPEANQLLVQKLSATAQETTAGVQRPNAKIRITG